MYHDDDDVAKAFAGFPEYTHEENEQHYQAALPLIVLQAAAAAPSLFLYLRPDGRRGSSEIGTAGCISMLQPAPLSQDEKERLTADIGKACRQILGAVAVPSDNAVELLEMMLDKRLCDTQYRQLLSALPNWYDSVFRSRVAMQCEYDFEPLTQALSLSPPCRTLASVCRAQIEMLIEGLNNPLPTQP